MQKRLILRCVSLIIIIKICTSMKFKSNYLITFFFLLIIGFMIYVGETLDLAIADHFYKQENFQSNRFLNFLYAYGILPAWIFTLTALVFFILSFLHPFWKAWRLYALLPLLTLIVGSGLIIHLTLKDHWGRPRPKQVIEFGGSQTFRPFYQPNFFHQPEPSKSFPSGHSSMGFYFFSIMLIGKRLGKRWLYYGGLYAALILGALLSYARVAQGGHFFTDVFFAALIMLTTAYFFDWLLFQKRILNENIDQKTV